MRDYHHAKAMAHTLREALTTKSVALSNSESLELIARILGFRDWNVLAAKLEAEAIAPSGSNAADPASAKPTLYCSFCGKSQHEVAKLIAGPDVRICNACVDLCDDVLLDEDTTFAQVTRESLTDKTTEELFLLKARIGRGLSTARRLRDTVRDYSLGGGAAESGKPNPQLSFFLRKPTNERENYVSEIESRVASMERAMATTVDLIGERAQR